MALRLIGSDNWQNPEDSFCMPDESVERCLKVTKWHNIAAMCSSMRDGIKCKIGGKFNKGTENVVKLIEFDDGLKWVARVRLEETKPPRNSASVEDQMKSEAATYKYLRKYTKLTIPDIFAYRTHHTEEFGPPFMVLTYIRGTPAAAFELSNRQALRLQKEMAEMIVDLAAYKFDAIGALIETEEGDFAVGKDLETNGGPYRSACEYYASITKSRLHGYADEVLQTNLEANRHSGIELPLLFQEFMPKFSNCMGEKGPFSLVNTDLGFHNLLIDESLSVVGVIDCDSFMVAPLHKLAQVPRYSDINIALPGFATKKPGLARMHRGEKTKFDLFVAQVAKAERRRASDPIIADAMDSDGARLVQGLEEYRAHAGWRNSDWISGYWYMYYCITRGPTGAHEWFESKLNDPEYFRAASSEQEIYEESKPKPDDFETSVPMVDHKEPPEGRRDEPVHGENSNHQGDNNLETIEVTCMGRSTSGDERTIDEAHYKIPEPSNKKLHRRCHKDRGDTLGDLEEPKASSAPPCLFLNVQYH